MPFGQELRNAVAKRRPDAVLNRRTGPVDSITIRSWDVPHGVKKPPDFGEKADWDIYRPTLDIDRLWELAEEYLRLFQEPDTEMR